MRLVIATGNQAFHGAPVQLRAFVAKQRFEPRVDANDRAVAIDQDGRIGRRFEILIERTFGSAGGNQRTGRLQHFCRFGLAPGETMRTGGDELVVVFHRRRREMQDRHVPVVGQPMPAEREAAHVGQCEIDDQGVVTLRCVPHRARAVGRVREAVSGLAEHRVQPLLIQTIRRHAQHFGGDHVGARIDFHRSGHLSPSKHTKKSDGSCRGMSALSPFAQSMLRPPSSRGSSAGRRRNSRFAAVRSTAGTPRRRLLWALLAVAGWAVITMASAALQTTSDTSLQELVTRHISWGVGAAAVFLLAVAWLAGWRDLGFRRPTPASTLWLQALYLLLLGILGLPTCRLSPVDMLVVLANTLMVGSSEELAFRRCLWAAARKALAFQPAFVFVSPSARCTSSTPSSPANWRRPLCRH